MSPAFSFIVFYINQILLGNTADPWKTGDARSQTFFHGVILTVIFTAMRIENKTLNVQHGSSRTHS